MKHPPRNIVIDWLNTIWETSLPPSSKLVACCLRRYMNAQNDMAWPSVARITGECGFKSDRTTQEHLKNLCSEGWLMNMGHSKSGTIIYQAATPAKIAPPQITTDTPATIAPELNKELNNTLSKGSTRFKPPTLQELVEYQKDKGLTFNSDNFIDYWVSVGWKRGRAQMKDWKATARTWARNENNGQHRPTGGRNPQASTTISATDLLNKGYDTVG